MANEMLAIVLAGGKGTRLEALTMKTSKPAVHFGGKYRIIDFVLSSLANSGVTDVGVVTQYESVELSNYCSKGKHWGFDGNNSEFSILGPRQKADGSHWYAGTGDAVYQNLDYMDSIDPEYVLILSADHIYKMNYAKMLAFTKSVNAECTIACLTCDEKDVSRFGILTLDDTKRVTSFVEKPKFSESRNASMGVYIFKYSSLRDALILDANNPSSSHDFGKDIIPYFLHNDKGVYGYPFDGYWKDVGTLSSLWEANMELIDDEKALDLYNSMSSFKIYTEDTKSLPQYIGPNARVTNSIINQGSIIFGEVNHSVLFTGAHIGEDSKIEDSVIMPGAIIGKNVHLKNVIVANNVVIEDGREVIGQVNDIKLITK